MMPAKLYSTARGKRWFTCFSCLLIGAATSGLAGRAAAAEGTALYIDEKGSVGIGTQRPGSPLSVSGGAAIGSQSFVEANTAPENGVLIEGRVGIGGPLRIGGTGDPDSKRALDVAAPGGMRIRQTQSQSEQNEIFFEDNGQIRSRDDNHRIIFDRRLNVMELREQGEIIFSAGASAGQRTRTVTVGAGGMNVNGSISAAVRYQRDDEAETTYQKSLQRYHLSLTAERYGGRTRTIPREVLENLCGRPDGCQVRLGMTRWGSGAETETASRLFVFYYSPKDGRWRTSADQVGAAGNGRTEHAQNIWNTCYFTDGTYAGYKDQGDQGTGMQLLVWNGYKNPARTCELTLIP